MAWLIGKQRARVPLLLALVSECSIIEMTAEEIAEQLSLARISFPESKS